MLPVPARNITVGRGFDGTAYRRSSCEVRRCATSLEQRVLGHGHSHRGGRNASQSDRYPREQVVGPEQKQNCCRNNGEITMTP